MTAKGQPSEPKAVPPMRPTEVLQRIPRHSIDRVRELLRSGDRGGAAELLARIMIRHKIHWNSVHGVAVHLSDEIRDERKSKR